MTALQPLPAARVQRVVIEVKAAAEPDTEPLHSADGQVRLEGARLVVSGGRGMAGPQGFAALTRIAESLGGALGGSLPAVDAGWVPVARQVGQSGAGVAGTTRIVAVNQDPEAPIFAVADVGVVADWRELLPLLTQHLESTRTAAAA